MIRYHTCCSCMHWSSSPSFILSYKIFDSTRQICFHVILRCDAIVTGISHQFHLNFAAFKWLLITWRSVNQWLNHDETYYLLWHCKMSFMSGNTQYFTLFHRHALRAFVETQLEVNCGTTTNWYLASEKWSWMEKALEVANWFANHR